jgi:hypothetical protein
VERWSIGTVASNTGRSAEARQQEKSLSGGRVHKQRNVIYQNPVVGARDGATTARMMKYSINIVNYRNDIQTTSYARFLAAN